MTQLTSLARNDQTIPGNQAKTPLEELYESPMQKGGLISKKSKLKLGNGEGLKPKDRMEELQRRKDREGGEHLEMMIKQTRRGAKKAKISKPERTFAEDKASLIEIIKVASPEKQEEEEKEEELREIKVDFSPEKKMEKVSLIDIKLEENPKEEVRNSGENEGDLKKRNYKEFKEDKLANMFESDNEDQQTGRSEENEGGFLQEQNEKKEREQRLKEEKAHEKMQKKVEGLMQKNSKLKQSEEEYDDKEEEPPSTFFCIFSWAFSSFNLCSLSFFSFCS